MTTQLREGIVERKPKVTLSGEVECDEVYVVAGHKGKPEEVKKKRPGHRRRLKGERGRGTLEKEKPPIFGMMQRSGEVVITMLPNVQQKTIAPLIKRTITKAALKNNFSNSFGKGQECLVFRDPAYYHSGPIAEIIFEHRLKELLSAPMNMTFTIGRPNGATPTTPCVTRPGSSPATRMGMDFAKSMSTRLRAFGRC